ncbi:MAG: 16S rRNA (cytidine(1402)-2'-O)-methyltransferase [Pseudomonadota bacterium]|nr:16S rRNA (cytidine(1402)-2'-O)-methyltransferase [Pseudomonadota bacterium]
MTGGAGEDAPAAARVAEPVFRAEGGALYVVATPVGNLRDVTLRALDILRTASVIAAEDTRVSATLLRHYGIDSRMIPLHEHNEVQRAPMLIEHLAAGRSVALISDAGTPAVSDPGARLVAAVRDAGFVVVPIPGPNAAIGAISAAGLRADRFAFLGFAPTGAKQRNALFASVRSLPCALVLYEAPHRVAATLHELATAFGGDRRLVIAREITKRFETIAAMTLAAAPDWLAADPNRSRGEFVLILDAPDEANAPEALDASAERWLCALLEHVSPAQAARIAAAATGTPREVVYARALSLKGNATKDDADGDHGAAS